MKKDKNLNSRNWEDYEKGNEELYSYVKKKGKHKRAKTTSPDKKV